MAAVGWIAINMLHDLLSKGIKARVAKYPAAVPGQDARKLMGGFRLDFCVSKLLMVCFF